MKEIAYDINGGDTASGTVIVEDNATDDEIRLAIVNDLFGVSYHTVRHIPDDTQPETPPVMESHDGYTPSCKYGHDDCIFDRAYIEHFYPDWYATLDKEHIACQDCENGDKYDNEDK